MLKISNLAVWISNQKSGGTIDTIVTMVLLTYYGTIVTIVYLGGTIINITNTISTNTIITILPS